jgi:hypothetical protein
MFRFIPLLLLLLPASVSIPLHAQTLTGTWAADSVITGPQYADDVWYHFSNGVVRDTARNNWHLAFAVPAGSAIYANHPNGARIYRVPFGAAAWAAVDTTGHITDANILYNDEASWGNGALNRRKGSGWDDLGWGFYDLQTHIISGDSIYLVRIGAAAPYTWKKLLIAARASGTYTFQYADLDGQNEQTRSIVLANFRQGSGATARVKNFIYFNLSNGEVMDREPFNDTWDLQFTQYTKLISGIPYPVSGVKLNAGVTAARVLGTAPNALNDTTGTAWKDSVVVVGDDWKQFTGGSWSLTPNLSWVIRTRNGSLWQFYFDGFTGSSQGKYRFQKRALVASSPASRRADTADAHWALYPNPARSQEVLFVRQEASTAATLLVRDVRGAVVHTTQVPAGALQALQLPTMAPGTYTVSLQSAQGQTHRKLLILP